MSIDVNNRRREWTMKHLITALSLLLATSGAAFAAEKASDAAKNPAPAAMESAKDAAPKLSEKDMKRKCNKEARAQKLKGDEHKAFMKTCLKG
jgi:hypothetical protein